MPDDIADHDRHTGPDVIGMVDYGDIEYLTMPLTRDVTGRWQEDIVAQMIKQMRAGLVSDLIYCLAETMLNCASLWISAWSVNFSWPALRHQSEKVAR